MAVLRCAINVPTEEQQGSKRARVQERVQTESTALQHVDLPDSVRKNHVASIRPIAMCLLAKDLIKLLSTCAFFFGFMIV